MLAWPALQHEPVAVRPARVVRGVAQEAGPQRVGHRRRAHRRARDARSSPAGRRRSRASGSCRWPAGRGPRRRRSWAWDSRWGSGADRAGRRDRAVRAPGWRPSYQRATAIDRYARGDDRHPPPTIPQARARSRARSAPAPRGTDRRSAPRREVAPAVGHRPRRPHARRRADARRGRWSGARTCPAGSCSARAARPRTPRAGSPGSALRVQLVCAVGRDGVGRALVDGAPARRRRSSGRPGCAGADRPDRRRRLVRGRHGGQRRALVRRRPGRRRRAGPGRSPVRLVPRCRRPPPAGLLAPRRAARRRPAAGRPSWPGSTAPPSASTSPRAGRSSPRARRAAQALLRSVTPDVLFATAGEAEALLGGWALGGPARVRAGRRHQARARRAPRSSPGARARRRSAPTSRRGRSSRPTRRAPATRSMPGSSRPGSRPGPPGSPPRSRSGGRRWPATGSPPASSPGRRRSSTSADGRSGGLAASASGTLRR